MVSSFLEFFSTKAVKQKIQTDKLSQAQLFIYFYIIILFDCIGSTQQSLSLIGRPPVKPPILPQFTTREILI